MLSVTLSNNQATLDLGKKISTILQPKLIIFLQGSVGSGKTTLVRGILNSLGYIGHVISPSYSLVESYKFLSLTLHHLDLYRLENTNEGRDNNTSLLELEDYFNSDAACLIEWPRYIDKIVPQPDIIFTMDYYKKQRRIEFSGKETYLDKINNIINLN